MLSLLIAILLNIYVGLAARRMGYSGIAWFFAGLLSAEPIATMNLLAGLPDRATQKARERERETVRSELAKAGAKGRVRGTAVPLGTISDLQTVHDYSST
jgi:hypothetical protein